MHIDPQDEYALAGPFFIHFGQSPASRGNAGSTCANDRLNALRPAAMTTTHPARRPAECAAFCRGISGVLRTGCQLCAPRKTSGWEDVYKLVYFR